MGRCVGRWVAAGIAMGALLGPGGTAVAGEPVAIDAGTPFGPCDEFLEPCGEPVTLAFGEQLGLPTEIVAFSSRVGLCVDVVHPRTGGGICGAEVPPVDEHRLRTLSFTAVGGRKPSREVIGAVSANVAGAALHFKRRSGWSRGEVLLGRAEGDMLRQLKVTEPFGILVAAMPSCRKRQKYRLQTFDSEGVPLSRAPVHRFPFGCPGNGAIAFGVF